jgi:ubiquinone/menaquinone biosynthesis C-methylase UbiE
VSAFDKYDTMGAYHWRECDRRSREFNPPLVARYEAVLKRVRGGKVLDVGAGDGYLAGKLSGRCDEVVALEFESSGVELARTMLAEYGNVSVQQGSSYELPFPVASFDAAVMADVIEHLEEPGRAVREIARVVKDSGQVVVTTPHWRPDRVWDERHVKEYAAAELQECLSEGFAAVELAFLWPRLWADVYHTALGWRALRAGGRFGFNPFLREGPAPQNYCQIVAVCRQPLRAKDVN